MTESDLGPMPDAEIEPGEPNPGGIDAVPHSDGVDGAAAEPDPLSRDLDPDDSPATGEVPVEVKQGEDTSTKATESAEGDDVPPEEEAPA